LKKFTAALPQTSTALLRVTALTLRPCIGCDACRVKTCVQKDDAPGALDRLQKARAVVMASPLYFYSFPASAKILIDRAYAAWPNAARPHTLKPAFLIATAGHSDMRQFAVIRKTTAAFLNTLGFALTGVFFLPDTDRITRDQKQAAIAECQAAARKWHQRFLV
jgi:multimeric flavodoxin WrbA